MSISAHTAATRQFNAHTPSSCHCSDDMQHPSAPRSSQPRHRHSWLVAVPLLLALLLIATRPYILLRPDLLPVPPGSRRHLATRDPQTRGQSSPDKHTANADGPLPDSQSAADPDSPPAPVPTSTVHSSAHTPTSTEPPSGAPQPLVQTAQPRATALHDPGAPTRVPPSLTPSDTATIPRLQPSSGTTDAFFLQLPPPTVLDTATAPTPRPEPDGSDAHHPPLQDMHTVPSLQQPSPAAPDTAASPANPMQTTDSAPSTLPDPAPARPTLKPSIHIRSNAGNPVTSRSQRRQHLVRQRQAALQQVLNTVAQPQPVFQLPPQPRSDDKHRAEHISPAPQLTGTDAPEDKQGGQGKVSVVAPVADKTLDMAQALVASAELLRSMIGLAGVPAPEPGVCGGVCAFQQLSPQLSPGRVSTLLAADRWRKELWGRWARTNSQHASRVRKSTGAGLVEATAKDDHVIKPWDKTTGAVVDVKLPHNGAVTQGHPGSTASGHDADPAAHSNQHGVPPGQPAVVVTGADKTGVPVTPSPQSPPMPPASPFTPAHSSTTGSADPPAPADRTGSGATVSHHAPQPALARAQAALEQHLNHVMGLPPAQRTRGQTAIPRIVHQVYGLFDDSAIPVHVLDSVDSFRSQNPGHTHILWGPQDVEEFVRQYWPAFWHAYRHLPLPVMKADWLRYMLVYSFGGVYSDMDTRCLKPVDGWSDGHDVAVIVGIEVDAWNSSDWQQSWGRQLQFCQWTFAAAPGHPLLADVLQRSLQLVTSQPPPALQEANVTEVTGPYVFTDAAYQYMAQQGFLWQNLLGRNTETQVGDMYVLSISGFSPGVGHMGAEGVHSSRAKVHHWFKGAWTTHHQA